MDNIERMVTSVESEDTFNVYEIFFMFLHHWKSIIVAMLAGGVLFGGIYTVTAKPTYNANVELYITSAEESNPYSDLQVSSMLTEDYVEVIKSRYVMGKVIEKLGLDLTVETLSNMIYIDNPEKTRCLIINVISDDPIMSKNIANAVLEISTERISKIITKVTPTIVDYADMDSVYEIVPSFENYVIIGAFGGAVLVCLVLLILMFMNTTLKTEEEVERALGITVLATVPYFKEK